MWAADLLKMDRANVVWMQIPVWEWKGFGMSSESSIYIFFSSGHLSLEYRYIPMRFLAYGIPPTEILVGRVPGGVATGDPFTASMWPPSIQLYTRVQLSKTYAVPSYSKHN